MPTSARSAPIPSRANAFDVQITTGSASERERGRDGVDREGAVGGHDGDDGQKQRRTPQPVALGHEQLGLAEPAGGRENTRTGGARGCSRGRPLRLRRERLAYDSRSATRSLSW